MLKSLTERVYIGHLLFTTEVVLPVFFANPYFILGWNYEMCLTGKEPDLRVEVFVSFEMELMRRFDSHFIKDKLIGYADIRLSNLPPGRQGLMSCSSLKTRFEC